MGKCMSKDATVGASTTKSVSKADSKLGNPTAPESNVPITQGKVGRDDSQSASERRANYRPGYSSGASTPPQDDASEQLDLSSHINNMTDSLDVSKSRHLKHSSSILGIDKMINEQKTKSLTEKIVHMEVPFGKPIEEVYEGVHDGPVLGSGISGLVRLCVHKKTGNKYAVKCLDLSLLETEESLEQLRDEIAIMCQLDHPNIVRLEEVYESQMEIYLVQELCTGGELFDRLDEQPDYHYTESQCAKLVKQMLCSVRYIHSKGIIHRDLKLENFLFSSTHQNSELKMIDFGLSKHFKYGEVQHEAVGTPYTVAPEVIHGSYDERCDVWAIGVITYLLLSGDPPFGGCGGPESLMEVRSNILAGRFQFSPEDIWENVSQDAKNFINKLLVTDPMRRVTARQCQLQPWLQKWANKDKKEADNYLNKDVVKALVNFKEYSDMRKLLCEVLSFTLLPEQITDLRKEFAKLDVDGSGEISLKGLKQVLMSGAGSGSLGALSEEEVEDIFNAMRVNKTETRIHWHEFIAAGLSQCKVDERNLRLAFDRLDSDHKGYVTFENIMDMMGYNGSSSEDEMRAMWATSMKACKCSGSHITYEGFLLLMKGQTWQAKDGSPRNTMPIAPQIPAASILQPLPELSEVTPGPMLGKLGVLHEMSDSNETDDDEPHTPTGDFLNMPITSNSPMWGSSSFDDGDDEPPTMDVDDDEDDMMDERISAAADQQMANISNSLTPPQSPVRSPKDFVTPVTGRFSVSPTNFKLSDDLPQLPLTGTSSIRRGRSKSMDDQDHLSPPPPPPPHVEGDAHFVDAVIPDIRRAMLLPEHGSSRKMSADDELKKSLNVNRNLYRAHRQMRLAVLEASKRFEEEQMRRTTLEVLKSHQPESRHYGAGLVMKRGKKKEVSSGEIRKLMMRRINEQKEQVEIAARKGGRGRQRRKKTVSDMSAMMSAISEPSLSVPSGEEKSADPTKDEPELNLHDIIKPEPTVLGVFRKSTDPFAQMGQNLSKVLGGIPENSHKVARRSSIDESSNTNLTSTFDNPQRSALKISTSDGELNTTGTM